MSSMMLPTALREIEIEGRLSPGERFREGEGAALSFEEWARGAVFPLSAGAAVFLPGGRERAKSMARVCQMYR